MFRLAADESSQNLGIEVHKLRTYVFEKGFLSGTVIHNSTSRDFGLHVSPNYRHMASIADQRTRKALRHEFDTARYHTSISIGRYAALDVVDCAVNALEQWYRQVLKQKGANHRFLVEEGNEQHLVDADHAADTAYGDAIIQARTLQAFDMLRQNQPLDHKTLVGKVMPIFLHALGLKEYGLSHDLSKNGYGEVRFTIEEIGTFAFYEPLNKDSPPYLERYSYRNGDYHCTFSGQITGDVMKHQVFDWLIGAAREMDTLIADDLDAHLDTLAHDVRRSFIQTPSASWGTFKKMPAPHPASNVVLLGALRPS